MALLSFIDHKNKMVNKENQLTEGHGVHFLYTDLEQQLDIVKTSRPRSSQQQSHGPVEKIHLTFITLFEF